MPQKKDIKKKTSTKKTSQKKQNGSTVHAIIPWILAIVAVFTAICLFFTQYSGVVGSWLNSMMLGLFAGAAYSIPVLLIILAIFWKRDSEEDYLKFRITYSATVLLSLSAFIHSFGSLAKVFNVAELWKGGVARNGGGVIGGLLGSLLQLAIGKPGLIIVTVILFVVFGIFLVGLTPGYILSLISTTVKENKKKKQPKAKKPRFTDKPEAFLPDDFEELYPNEEPIDDAPAVDPEIFERIKNEINDSIEEEPAPAPKIGQKKFPDEEGTVDLEAVFLDDEAQQLIENAAKPKEKEILEIERTPIGETEEKKPVQKEKPKYVFPPIDLLSQEKKSANEDITEELRTNANKLVETLNSFKVRTKIIDISRGPAITRYELQPEEGIRVRQIANLVDDISLSLASSGIRIEAPIPGKAAVGIEVPNKTRTVVGLREQLESNTFKNAKSRLTASLGVDVAGEPIYMDIAKMPHLLVAGATGQGKSVCINSIIVSILYKATPDEVKFILIDPKKVEFVPYNGLPHLLVPVVTDPKKAAGSLQWAVTEMERRYQLMESMGVRDIYNFNIKTKDDPTYEFIPQVVIIIDELADLMMTAPDQVEDSICRLAQKARAAGMHLILGTQRPSVDVVTGLIKANIPSRISCKTTSQVDSRTILDMAGAEKLIGRGDMLYAPVGAAKPMRVQGSFVHEDDVSKVTEFIRAKSGESEYDTEVIEKIEKEAAKCGIKKGSAPSGEFDADDEDADPMLNSAIELAVESGKISTSLIQRKLSLGYGRAAKLIDTMEKMGIVGAPEGNKPRQVLISATEYLEMSMRQNDIE